MTKSIAINDLTALLDAAKGGFVDSIVADQAKKALAVEKRGSNVETRKAAWREAAAKGKKKDIQAVLKAAKEHPSLAKLVATISTDSDAHVLDENEAVLVTEQVLAGKLLEEWVKATYETARNLVFASLDVQFAEQGEDFPEHTNGYIDVPELGKRLSREGAGRKDSGLDEEKLLELIGDEAFASISVEVTTRKVDESLLIAAVAANPELLEQVRASIEVGDWKTPRFTIRDIPANEKE
jgi:hypothetical protein